MAEVESFTLDHTKVIAPYVRLISTTSGEKGDQISNYDVRLTQPNQQDIPTAALHTLEHFLAGKLRDYLDNIIDISPFGCRTGFHLLIWGKGDALNVAKALKATLIDLAENADWDDIQGVDIVSCGNYRDHSLFGAKEWAKTILANGISADPFTRQLV